MKSMVAIGIAAVALAGCGGGGYGGGSSSAGTTKTTTAASGGPTLYTFARDSTGKSNCSGACAKNWPPAPPTLKTPAGLAKGRLGTIKRADGTTQLAYRGRPLYTFAGDTQPGDAKGNGVNAFGGVWSTAAPTPAAAPSRSGY
jgi:predicted lipoprotein with Yx(FWY)xxD motif